jgi:acetyltransferase-like isoleucine patch superfamily enzyme
MRPNILLRKFGRLFGSLSKIVFHINTIKDLIYSGYYAKQFNGNSEIIYIEYPVSLINGARYITIGSNFFCRARLRMEAITINKNSTPNITIGNNVQINNNCHIACINNITIGNNVLIASNVFITDHSHGRVSESELNTSPANREMYSKGPVIIEDNVWIGQNVSIMPNVTIGKNAIIGANSVVTKDVPENVVTAGSPSKVIKILSQ